MNQFPNRYTPHNYELYFDYAVYPEAYGSLYLCLNEKDKAKSCFTESLRIYSNIYADAPALIEEKVKEINLWYHQGLPDF